MAEQLSFQAAAGGSIPTSPLHFVLCESLAERNIFRETIDTFHSYMKYKDTCNRRLNWNVYSNTGEVLAGVGVNSAILALGVRDKAIGWAKEARKKHLNQVANNYRFAVRRREKNPLGLGALRPAGVREKSGIDLPIRVCGIGEVVNSAELRLLLPRPI